MLLLLVSRDRERMNQPHCLLHVAGLPTTRKDHAVTMARFARECLHKMNELLPILEVSLGPETSNLSFRVGIHSGPVTAGVLRGNNGEKFCFCLS